MFEDEEEAAKDISIKSAPSLHTVLYCQDNHQLTPTRIISISFVWSLDPIDASLRADRQTARSKLKLSHMTRLPGPADEMTQPSLQKRDRIQQILVSLSTPRKRASAIGCCRRRTPSQQANG
jgi:hypothetical protein